MGRDKLVPPDKDCVLRHNPIFLHWMQTDGRKRPVHLPALDRFNTPIIIFVTICTKDRKPILANDAAHQLLCAAWQLKTSWVIGRYMIMPDHLHLFCAPGEPPSLPLPPWVKFWKSHSARFWPDRNAAPVWQRDFWDTQLRRGESYTDKWNYVVYNPVRAGLVGRPEEWPYQGELNVFRW